MADWDLYRQLLELEGASQRERTAEKMRRTLHKKAEDAVASQKVEIDGVPGLLILHSTAVPNEKTFHTMPDEGVALGQIVSWKNKSGNIAHWIITEVDFNDDIAVKGRMERCNRKLIWQNAETLEIVSRWCTAKKPYYSNLDEGKVITMSSREYKIQIPYDAETSLLELDKRFLLEKVNSKAKAYKITSLDTITERYDENEESKGFLVLNITQDNFNPDTDNVELMIADYVAPIDDEPDEDLRCFIKYSGEAKLSIGGTYRVFRAVFTDVGGQETTTFSTEDGQKVDISPQWKLELVDDKRIHGLDFVIEESGWVAKLKAANDYSLENVIVRLSVADQEGRYSAFVDLTIKAGW